MSASTPTLPASSDFSPDLKAVICIPPNTIPSNILLFLPGLGDTSTNFSSFANALNLPETYTITLQPPFPLPFPVGPGFSWSEDLQFDQARGKLDAEDSPVTKSTTLIATAISEILINKCGFRPTQIHLFGYGQGGAVALSIPLQSSLCSAQALGSVISLGGPLPLSLPLPPPHPSPMTTTNKPSPRSRTPTLLVGGSRGAFPAASTSPSSPVKRVQERYEFVEQVTWKRGEDLLPRNRDEVLPLMRFWGRRLGSRRGVPEGAIEVT